MSCNFTGETMRSPETAADGTRGGAAGRFLRREDGAALIEFAIVLPMMLFVFAVIIEGSRLLLSYQAAIAGVRDASRYLARTVDPTICTSGGTLNGYSARLQAVVSNALTAKSVFASGVTVNSVSPSYSCVTGDYRHGPVAIAAVTAQITVTFPFSGLFTLVGQSRPTLATTVTDRARVFGS